MSKVHKMQRKQAKKLASILGMTAKEVLTGRRYEVDGNTTTCRRQRMKDLRW